jgi:hypothetical protein
MLLGVAEEKALSRASFAFGEVELGFECADSAWLSFLDRRYGKFSIAPVRDAFTVRFEPTEAALPAGVTSPLAPQPEAVGVERTAAGFRASTETTECEIDLRERRAVLRGPSAMYPLDNVLRHLLPLLWEDGLILHAALVEIGEGSVLACGPSGAGKSTIAKLSRGRALSDELTAVRNDGGRAEGIALPFWEARPGRARLDAILHLRHGASHDLSPLRSGESLRLLASQVLWPVWDEKAMARAFGQLAELAAAPAYALSFAPREDVWELIEEEIS